MRILLVAPASGNWRHLGRHRLFGGRTFRFSMLSLLTVAAENPADVEVEIVDEQVDDLPAGSSYDLVGITCMTAAAPRTYEIADRFRRRGVPVVLGGMHPTFCPEEALGHADAVCVGEAEGVWPAIVEDARTGRLGGLYRAARAHDLSGLRPPPRHRLSRRSYATIQAVQATRGCPRRCAFCSVSAFHDGVLRCRPVREVIDEIASLPRRFFMFVDDNLTADPDYAEELFRGLTRLDRLWIGQSTLGIVDHPALVRSAARSGCMGLFVGLESFSAGNLGAMDKGFHRVGEYREKIRSLHAHGIGVQAGIVFGFDGDTREVFGSTLRLLDDLEIDMVQVSILTPLPGTRYFDAMGDRIVDRDWASYDYHHVVFEPRRMSRRDLQQGHDWVTREFYRPWRIARRLGRIARRGAFRTLPYAAAINGAYYGRTVRWRIEGADPATFGSEGARDRPASARSPAGPCVGRPARASGGAVSERTVAD